MYIYEQLYIKFKDEDNGLTEKELSIKSTVDKPFTVKSEKAYILTEDPDIVYMTNMHVILYLNDGRVVNIVSDKGRYNKISFDCFFRENVKATEGNTMIVSDNLDLLATENSVVIYNNVSLNYDIRLKQKKSSEKENGNMNISLKISEIFPIKEDDLLKKIKNDIYLRESVKLFVDMINFKKT